MSLLQNVPTPRPPPIGTSVGLDTSEDVIVIPKKNIPIIIAVAVLSWMLVGAVCLIAYAVFIPAPTQAVVNPVIESVPEAIHQPVELEVNPESKLLEWEGTGDKVVSFDTSGFSGLLVSSAHFGSGNFVILVKDSSGNRIGNAANCIGRCDSSKLVKLRGDGSYFLEVKANGEWIIVAEPLK